MNISRSTEMQHVYRALKHPITAILAIGLSPRSLCPDLLRYTVT